VFGYRLDPGVRIDAPLIGWFVDGASKRILIDTGGPDPIEVPRRAPYRRDEKDTIERALENLGLKCDQIDIVIITHLHWDHCGGVNKFPQAQIIVQEEELAEAKSPLPLFYHNDFKKYVEDTHYIVVSGDKQIVEGVSVHLTPGHTYGLQGVLINTGKQRYFIASDTVGLFECMERKPFLVSGVYVDLRKYYESLTKIVKLSATILPGHDVRVFDKESYG
jgi:glyoxylase-like metal-dependent hydrolase (beta-lactamase superfamily II)